MSDFKVTRYKLRASGMSVRGPEEPFSIVFLSDLLFAKRVNNRPHLRPGSKRCLRHFAPLNAPFDSGKILSPGRRIFGYLDGGHHTCHGKGKQSVYFDKYK